MSWFRSSRRRHSAEAPEAEAAPALALEEVEGRPLADLHALAAQAGVPRFRLLRREQLVAALTGGEVAAPERPPAPAPVEAPRERETADVLEERPLAEELEEPAAAEEVEEEPAPELEEPPAEELEGPPAEGEPRTGVLDLVADGYGFLRVAGLLRSPEDAYVPRELVRRHGLLPGQEIEGLVVGGPHERRPRLASVETVEGRPAREPGPTRTELDALPARRPSRPLDLGDSQAARMLALVAPLARGQRALVTGPPGSGATSLLRAIAQGVAGSGARVMVALVDVRPEEVPEWDGRFEVVAADAARSPREQVALAELALERAKRLAEVGADVVLVLDSISRLTRAYALARGAGAGESPAVGPAAVETVKRWFAAARDAGDGSLTIIAAARADSESAFETLVYEALEDSAGTVVRLDPELAAKGKHPAIDASRSRTLGEEALIGEERRRTLENMRGVARSLDPVEAWEFLAERARELRASVAGGSEIVAKAYEALNARDMDALLALLDEDVEWVNAPDAVDPGIRRGHDGFRTAVENAWAAFGNFEYDLASVEAAGPRVLVQATLSASSGGMELTEQTHHVWTVRADRIVRFEWFNSRAEAVAAVRGEAER